MRRYLLIIEGVPGDFGAFFPDLPSVCAFAESKNALLERVTRAAEEHLRHNTAPRPHVRSEEEIEAVVTRVQQSRPVFHTMVCLKEGPVDPLQDDADLKKELRDSGRCH
jgi:predicted RNase H-like HicB family nuclease